MIGKLKGPGLSGQAASTVQPAAPAKHSVFKLFDRPRGVGDEAGSSQPPVVGGAPGQGGREKGLPRNRAPSGLDLTGVDWGQLGGDLTPQAAQMGSWVNATNAWNANQQGAAPVQPQFPGSWWHAVGRMYRKNQLPMLPGGAPGTPPPVTPPADTGGLGDVIVPPPGSRPRNPNFPWI